MLPSNLLTSLVLAFSVSAFAASGQEEYVEGYSDVKMGVGEEGYVIGEALFFPSDTDMYSLGFVSKEAFEQLAYLTTDDYIDYENQIVNVEAGGVYTMNIRNTNEYDIFAPRSYKYINEYDKKDIKYACFGRRYTEVDNGVLQCAIFYNNKNILTNLIERGLAKYYGNIEVPFIDRELSAAQSIAIKGQRGMWSPYYKETSKIIGD